MGGYSGVIGALPVAKAPRSALLLAQLVRMERNIPKESPKGAGVQGDPGRLAFVAGAVLACVDGAIPLQLDASRITIGWALLAAALAPMYLRIPTAGCCGGPPA